MSALADSGAVLVLVDVQRGFDHPGWGPRNNPSADQNIEALLRTWSDAGARVVFVRHDSIESGSPLATGTEGNRLKDYLNVEPSLTVTKRVNSAFLGEPSLDGWLREVAADTIVIAGITTNHCCETTARMAGNLGYRTYFALDATYTFDRRAPDGRIVTAEELSHTTAANLHEEFATVVSTAELVS